MMNHVKAAAIGAVGGIAVAVAMLSGGAFGATALTLSCETADGLTAKIKAAYMQPVVIANLEKPFRAVLFENAAGEGVLVIVVMDEGIACPIWSEPKGKRI